eukprot:gene7715-8332_t
MTQNLEKTELFLSAENLPLHSGLFTHTYPFAVLYEVDRVTRDLKKVGRTDKMNNLNPSWAQSFVVEFLFEVRQDFVIKVFHADDSKDLNNESHHRFIGEIAFELATVLCSSTKTVNLPLVNPSDRSNKALGHLIVRTEAKADTRDLFCVTFSANNLANKEGFFAKSDPFIRILRCNEDGSYSPVWESPVVKDSLNPRWAATKLSLSKICNGDIHRPLRFEIYDHEKSGKHVFMGQVSEVSIASLVQNRTNRLNVIEPDKQKDKKYVNSGVLVADDCSIEKHYSFAQYIQGGLEIGLTVAIDYTGSNGDPRMSDSLHYIHPIGEQYNQYEQAILSVGQVLEPYDHDKEYTVYGFGARIKDSAGEFGATAEHCFAIVPGGGAQVHGVDGILKAYKESVTNVIFSGPTLFTPVISATAAIADSLKCRQDRLRYQILLILTDGTINDMETTINTLIQASALPISVLVVGVGHADFSEMRRLDSDGKQLSAGGRTATRDIVQFVPFQQVAREGGSVLAQQLLAEIPNQVIQYMEEHHLVPNSVGRR